MIFMLLSLFFSFNSVLYADSAEVKQLSVEVHTDSKESLQRGAKIFMNYCSGCHSLRYMRYNRMAKDLGLVTFNGDIDTDLLQNNLIFTQAKVTDPIQISMPEVDARQWFGRLPPDLSLTARERGPAWIYTYLNSFYADPKRPFGTNNLLVPDASMPNVLFPLGGLRVRKGGGQQPESLILMKEGTMTPQQYEQTIEDVVTFLSYVSEPIKATRYKIGRRVLPFLCLCFMMVYLLKKSYWKKIQREETE